MGSIPPWAYAILCVVVPVGWGLLVVVVTSSLERFFFRPRLEEPGAAQDEHDTPPPLEYHI